MDLEMSTQSPNISNASSEEPSLPFVNIYVTADIRFTHHAFVSSDDIKDPKVAVNISPYEIFGEQNNEANICTKSKSKYSPVVETSLSQEFYLQPIVRRSKKSTQLNFNIQDKNYINNKRNIINRTVILPYFGCSKKYNKRTTFNRNIILVKSSKSWEKVTKSSNTVKKEALFRSKSLSRSPSIQTNQQLSDNQIFEDLLSYPFNKSKPLTPNYNIGKHPAIRSLYHVEDLKSGSQILFYDATRIRYLCTPIINSVQNPNTDSSNITHSKFISNKNNSFGEEMLKPTTPQKYSPKPTRNVSILHRPRTRNQATSTSSLNILNNHDKGLDDSIKGLLKPYIAAEKAFPSELILKLVPKEEVLDKNKINKDAPAKDDHKIKTTHSSETDLLAPMLTTSAKENKRKGRLFSCFSKSKKKKGEDNNCISGSKENLNKEVYYPSAVEVHHNK